MHTFAFYLFALLAVTGGILLVAFRNPVSSALSMVLSFIGLAGLFIGLNAYFVGIVQVLVYAGAIMVLFIFIIMLLDLNDEIPLLLVAQVLGVIQSHNQGDAGKFAEITEKTMKESATAYLLTDDDGEPLAQSKQTAIYKSLTHEKSPKLPDTNLIGNTIFKRYNFPLQIMGALLLVATIGVVVLSKRNSKTKAPSAS